MSLEQRIEQQIADIDAVADQMPGVIIIHDIPDASVRYMSPRGLQQLGTTMDELRAMGAAYHSRFFNAAEAEEYVPKMIDFLQRNEPGASYTLFQQVRRSEHDPWMWYLSTIRILMWDDEGRPLLTIAVAQHIDPVHHLTSKVSRLLEENNFLRRSQHIYASLTRKEKEIVRLIATGKSSRQIAEAMFISDQTAQTHRRNIKAKLAAESDYDITKFAQAFDLI